MKAIIVQSYIRIERAMIDFEQKCITHHCEIIMFPDRIKTEQHEFGIKEVFDMSYKPLGGEEGLLYLHTKYGVYSYMVRDHPKAFIQKYKELLP